MNTDDIFNEYEPDLKLTLEDTPDGEFQQFLMEPFEISYRLDPIDQKRGFHYFLDIDKAAYIHDIGYRKKYVVVYLAFITEDEEGRKSYSFDLVTPFGLNNYLRYISANENANTIKRIATFIQFRNLKTNQELEEKCYYLLELDSLDREKIAEQSDLYMSIYDFGDLKASDAAIPELKPLVGLKGLIYKGKTLPVPIIPAFPQGKLKLQVNNVGQGNWNEIKVRNKTRVVYDLGTYIEKKSRDSYVDALIKNHTYDRKPSLVLSHWDLDHYNILLFMSQVEWEQFSQLIAVSSLPSLTPFRLLNKIVTQTKVRLSLVDNHFQTHKGLIKRIDVNNRQLKLFVCPLKMSSKRLDTNESGLLLDVDSVDKNILLTGDCSYPQANEAIRKSYANITLPKDHYLVVPHHGGGHKLEYQLPVNCRLIGAAISVDEFGDRSGVLKRRRYGHPTIEVINHFVNKHQSKVYRTDYSDIII